MSEFDAIVSGLVVDPAPLTGRQLRFLGAAAIREFTWGLPMAVSELRRWRRHARRIRNPALRGIAVRALDEKRSNTHGAGLFAVIPHARSRPLLRLLTTHQVMWDFLDSLTETWSGLETADHLHLHLALADAVTPAGPPRDYYAGTSIPPDRDYLQSLVHACRRYARALPSFTAVEPRLRDEALRIGAVQAINHGDAPEDAPTRLREWAAREYPAMNEATWFELAAAACTNIAIYPLFALAAEPSLAEARVAAAYRAHFPWSGASAAMLDAFVDQFDDARNGDHSYIRYYGSKRNATTQISRLAYRCLSETHALDDGERHALVAAAMIAMYLARDSAHSAALTKPTAHILHASGSLTETLLPAMRLWRLATGSRAS